VSTPQRNDARVIAVDPQLGDILRTQTLAVLEFNHHHFEDLRDLDPEAQLALSVIYRDAFAILDTLGWHPNPATTTTFIPLTCGHIDQLTRCRDDVERTILDRLDTINHDDTDNHADRIRSSLQADRAAARGLERLAARYQRTSAR
jgi:hypothetical protein